MVERSSVLDHTYMALAHPTRRSIMELLRTGPTRVTDLAGSFEVSLAAVSKHIGLLERSGLVVRTVIGRDHFLAPDVTPLAEAENWIQGYRQFWDERLDALDRHLLGHK